MKNSAGIVALEISHTEYIVLRYTGGSRPMPRSGQPGVEIPYEVLEEFRYDIRRFLNFSERAARQAGIEPQQHQALLAIKTATHRKKASVGVLAERLMIQHHSAVELCNRLEEKSLIRRSRNSVDRREVLLHLTPAGETLLEDLSALHRTELQTTGPRLLKALQSVIRRAGPLDGSREPEQTGREVGSSAAGHKSRTLPAPVAGSPAPHGPRKRK
jgi:DNA-binding MarR family transcriptional regulator